MLPRTLLLLALLALLLPLARAEALPALFFDGTLTYSQATGIVTVEGPITATLGLASPVSPGGELRLTATFASLTAGGVIVATLDPLAGGPGFSVVDAANIPLLLGDLTTAAIGGAAGSDLGGLAAELHLTGGALLAEFTDPSNLFALTLNLSAPFDPTLFDADFGGDVDGRIEATAGFTAHQVTAIPEPSTAVLLLAGLPLLLSATRCRGIAMLRVLLLALLLLPAGRAAAAVAYPAFDIDTLAGDLGLVTGGGGNLSLDGTAYQLLLAPATFTPIPHVPFTLVASGAHGSLTVGTPGSELLTADFDNFEETTFTLLGLTSTTFRADLSYTGGSFAGGLSGGRIEGAIREGGAITARIGAIAATAPGVIGAAVPEPTSLLLLGSTACLLLARRRMFR